MKWRRNKKVSMTAFAVTGTSLFCIFILSCVNTVPIEKDIFNAEMVVKQAETSDVQEYAPMELRLAKEKLQKAQSAFEQKNYESAQYLAEEARVTADLAQEKTRTEKIKALMKELQESIETMKKELMRVHESSS